VTEQPRRARQPEVVVELRVNRPAPGVPAAEQHLGDRMAAFVDGELDHEARERVQSHLAGCAACLARAEEERRLKSRLAASTPPDPSDLLLSRLMAISVDDSDSAGHDRRPPGSGSGGSQMMRGVFGGNSLGSGGSGFGAGLFGRGALGADNPLPGVDPRAERGATPFRGEQRPIAARMDAPLRHDVPRREPAPGPLRAASAGSLARGRRFAFAAAGAFSVAAVALGSAVTGGRALRQCRAGGGLQRRLGGLPGLRRPGRRPPGGGADERGQLAERGERAGRPARPGRDGVAVGHARCRGRRAAVPGRGFLPLTGPGPG